VGALVALLSLRTPRRLATVATPRDHELDELELDAA
jgi:hypothetical protein